MPTETKKHKESEGPKQHAQTATVKELPEKPPAAVEKTEPVAIVTPGGKVLNEEHPELHAPRDVKLEVQWRPPENVVGITHWRVYVDGVVVAELPIETLSLELHVETVEVSAYGMGLGMESAKTAVA